MTRKTMRNIGFGIFALFSATIVAFLSFISLELSIAVFALCAVAMIITVERGRRAHWEQAVDFKFSTINKKHDALSREVTRNRNAVNDMQSDIVSPAGKNAVSFESLVKTSKASDDVIKPKPLKMMTPANISKDEITKRKAPTMTVIEDADSLSDMVVEELTGYAVKNRRVDIFMQPIMRLPQRQRKYYEVFSRVRAKPGVYIPASRYLGLAEKNDQIQDIDALLLNQCLDIIKNRRESDNLPSFFINITAQTLKNSQFMNKLLLFLSKNRGLSDKLVFEMKQSEFHDLDIPVLKIIGGLAKLGCSFSLDHVSSLDEDIRDLQRFNVRFLKANAAMFEDAAKDERRYKAVMKAKRSLEGNGIGLIAEKIETEDQMRSLLDYELHYGQGYLFGRPDLEGAYEPKVKNKSG